MRVILYCRAGESDFPYTLYMQDRRLTIIFTFVDSKVTGGDIIQIYTPATGATCIFVLYPSSIIRFILRI